HLTPGTFPALDRGNGCLEVKFPYCPLDTRNKGKRMHFLFAYTFFHRRDAETERSTNDSSFSMCQHFFKEGQGARIVRLPKPEHGVPANPISFPLTHSDSHCSMIRTSVSCHSFLNLC